MARYGPVRLEIAYTQYLDRPDGDAGRPAGRTGIDDRLAQLPEDPRGRTGS